MAQDFTRHDQWVSEADKRLLQLKTERERFLSGGVSDEGNSEIANLNGRIETLERTKRRVLENPDYADYLAHRPSPTAQPQPAPSGGSSIPSASSAWASLKAGATEAATLPERLIKRGTEAGFIPKSIGDRLTRTPAGKPSLANEGMQQARAQEKQAYAETGDDPDSLAAGLVHGLPYAGYGGPTVTPGPILSRIGLKNLLKGGAANLGLTTASKASEGETPSAGEAAGSFLIGGGVTSVLGKLMGKKPAGKLPDQMDLAAETAARKPTALLEQKPWMMPDEEVKPAGLLTDRTKKPPITPEVIHQEGPPPARIEHKPLLLEQKPAPVTIDPRRALPAPEAHDPGPIPGSLLKSRFRRAQEPASPPPNAAGAREDVLPPMERAIRDLNTRPSPGYPATEEGAMSALSGKPQKVKPKEPSPEEEVAQLAKELNGALHGKSPGTPAPKTAADAKAPVAPAEPSGAASTQPKPAPSLKAAPATYQGFQKGWGPHKGFHLYNLTEDLPGHPVGSTVSDDTLRKLGFEPPPPPPVTAKEPTKPPTSPTVQQASAKPAEGELFAGRDTMQVGAKPIIGREAQPHEAPLFSKQAQTPEPEQVKMPEIDEGLQLRAQIAKDQLEIRDSEPGGYKWGNEEGQITGGLQSTYPEWYKTITTRAQKDAQGYKVKGSDPLPTVTRKQVDDVLAAIADGRPLPNTKYAQIVVDAIGRDSHLASEAEYLGNLLKQAEAGAIKDPEFGGVAMPGRIRLADIKARLKAAWGAPEGIETNAAPTGGIFHRAMRPVESPRFAMRKTESGSKIVGLGEEGIRKVNARFNRFFEDVTGQRTDVGLAYNLPPVEKARIGKILRHGDATQQDFSSPAGVQALIRNGLSIDEIRAYQGIRSTLDSIHKETTQVLAEMKRLGVEPDAEIMPDVGFGYRKGYFPRTWGGSWELSVNGKKLTDANGKGGSSFTTEGDAFAKAHAIKAQQPDAKIAIVHHAADEPLQTGPIEQSVFLHRLKRNLEGLNSVTPKMVDEAFAKSKGVGGFKKHLEERTGAQGYDVGNEFDVLRGYLMQAARFVELSKFKMAAAKVLDEATDLRPDQVRYLENHISHVLGRPAWDELAVRRFVNETPLRRWISPSGALSLLDLPKKVTAHALLGVGNVSSAAIDALALVQHVWPGAARMASQLGITDPVAAEKAVGEAVKWYAKSFVKGNEKDHLFRKMLESEAIINPHMMIGPVPMENRTASIEWWSTALKRSSEHMTQAVAARTAYNLARSQGLPEENALRLAYEKVGEWVGTYTKADQPQAYRGIVGGNVGLFKRFMTLMFQNAYSNLGSGDTGTIARYVAGTVGLAGLWNMIPGGDALDTWLTRTQGFSPRKLLSDNLPKGVVEGILSVGPEMAGFPEYNVSIGRRIGVNDYIPQHWTDLFGPVITRAGSGFYELASGNTEEAAKKLILPNSIRAILYTQEGKVLGRRDRTVINLQGGERTVKSLGFMPQREADERNLTEYAQNRKTYRTNRSRQLVDQIIEHPDDDAARSEFRELGGRSRQIREERKRKEQTLVERERRMLPRVLRREVMP